MNQKKTKTENKILNLALKYLEYSKDQLYHHLGDDEYARKSIRKWFPIDDFLNSIDEGKELAHSDTLKLIELIDDIIFQIVDGSVRSKKLGEGNTMKLKDLLNQEEKLLGQIVKDFGRIKSNLLKYTNLLSLESESEMDDDPDSEMDDLLSMVSESV
jgi:hypothetical protein